MGRRNIFSLITVLAIVVTFGAGLQRSALATPQPSYDSIRIQDSGLIFNYQVSVDWSPVIVPMPDGGAWLFFTAQLEYFDPQGELQVSPRRIFASRFNPDTANWSTARAVPSQLYSFGQAAVADAEGNVHLVFTQRPSLNSEEPGVLSYVKISPDGVPTEAVAIAPDVNAGHQLYPDMALDASGGVHLIWQDQRAVTAETGALGAGSADIFTADLGPDGAWSTPVQVNVRPDENTNANLPRLVADGDRLVAVWSVYTADSTAPSATSVAWSSRPLGDANAWAESQVLFDQGDTQIGGRFLDLASDPTGGVVLLYGQRTDVSSALIVRRLPAGATEWSAPNVVATGDRGSYPTTSVAPDGTFYAVYNAGDQTVAEVGGFGIAPGATFPPSEAILTDGENGAQGIASVAIDQAGRVWVAYLNEVAEDGITKVNSVRVLRGAFIPSIIAPAAATPEPEVAGTPSGAEEPVVEATPSS